MRISTTSTLVFSALFLFASPILAQKHPVVHLGGGNLRAPLSLPAGETAVSLCGLREGETYFVVAAPKASGQAARVALSPSSTGEVPGAGGPTLRFRASGDCAELVVSLEAPEADGEVPMYLSATCETCAAEASQKGAAQAEQAIMQVQGGFTAKHLVENVLVGGGCFEISNVTYFGQPGQIGTFSNGQSNIGISNGVIMATGGIQVAASPNNSGSASAGYGISTPDTDLSTLTSGIIFDKAVIEFDFVPTQNQVAFEYVFASEEYCEYVGDVFNDVFGFFISGPGIVGTKNIALVPNTNTPITINTVNHLNNSQYYTHNIPNFNLSCITVPPATGPAPQEVQYDGFTKKMVAVANVIPCETYHIKLKVADVIDGVWDSAVFLRANSFDAGGSVLATPAYPGGYASAYENCDAGHIRFTRGNSDLSQPLTVHFNVSGTATPGLDYEPLASPVVIPAGQSQVLVPIKVIPDMLAEGAETIVVTIPNACACTQSTITFVINDRPDLVASLENQTLCAGETALLAPAVYGGLPNRQYLWSTGETTASISPVASGVYAVTVSDGCNGNAEVAAEINFTACSGCVAETFWLNIREDGADVRGNGIYESPDGNLFVTGLRQDSALLVKMTPKGDMLWMRAFDVVAGENDRISDLLVDSDGMLVGCGHSSNTQSLGAFAFRYNPVTNNMQWLNTYANETPRAYGIVELPNGNYLIYDQARKTSSDIRFLEITRQDGTVLEFSPLTQNLHHELSENVVSAVVQGDKLYATGRTRFGNFLANDRHVLLRFDLASATVDWANASHVDPNALARFVGADLVLDAGAIVSAYYGNETGASLVESRIFLQKSTLDGGLLWLKRYEVPEAGNAEVEEVVSTPDGYILFARDRGTTDGLYLLKTDKGGALLWAKKATVSAFNDFLSTQSNVQSQLLVQGDRLFWAATTESPLTGLAEMLVVKTDLDANLEGDCVLFQPLDVAVSDVAGAVVAPVPFVKLEAKEEGETIVAEPKNAPLAVASLCRLLIYDSALVRLCEGSSVEIGGISFAQDTVFTLEIPGSDGACDTLRTYTVHVSPLIELAENISFCQGSSVTIGGQVYDQPGTVTLTLAGANGACDTIATYTLAVRPIEERSESLTFCQGSSVTIGGQVYDQPGTVTLTLAGTNGACDTVVTYTIEQLPQPSLAKTISFCPGETVVLGGNAYTQPGTVTLTLPGANGACDTLATYTLVKLTPAPSNVSLVCPNAITIGQPSGAGGAVVSYSAPAAASDCPCPGLSLTLAQGLPSGSLFPQGATQVCYVAKDSCGQSASCCFTVTIEEEEACDVKVSGCLKFELLTITEDAGKNRTYRVRVTNNCPNKLLYTALQVPSGVTAMSPAAFSTYTAPSGNTYSVRNPNFSPQYSVRFSSLSDSINLGESDIFRYTLPAQSNMTFMHVMTRLAPYVYVGAHLNTFYCPIGVTPLADDPAGEERGGGDALLGSGAPSGLMLFPNPTSGEIFVETGDSGEDVLMSVFDSRGQLVFGQNLRGNGGAQLVSLPETLANGLYIAHFRTESGAVFRERVVLQRQ